TRMTRKSRRKGFRYAGEKAGSPETFVPGELPIRGQTIPTRTGFLPVFDLRFFPDNPRVYSLVHGDDHEPSQEAIERKLLEMDHVKHLIQDIKNHGGLIEP